ncbi:hypothetical protein PtB15_17B433 [Puccinia triticina]|nr:hypothetical protein PtB15_17B433 [Puccinia triticina]
MRRGYNPVRLYLLPKPVDSSYKEIKKTHPTQAEYEAAEKNIQENFTKLNYGKILLLEKESSPAVSETNKDPFDEDQFIAYIEFTTSEDLSQEDLADVQFVAAFLQKSKKFVGKVQSVCKNFRGWMLSIGWRKSQTPGKTAGIFRNLKEIIKNTCAYLDHVFNGKLASEAIH